MGLLCGLMLRYIIPIIMSGGKSYRFGLLKSFLINNLLYEFLSVGFFLYL